jgi:hypothetical protein
VASPKLCLVGGPPRVGKSSPTQQLVETEGHPVVVDRHNNDARAEVDPDEIEACWPAQSDTSSRRDLLCESQGTSGISTKL